jgi:hypothetical protein
VGLYVGGVSSRLLNGNSHLRSIWIFKGVPTSQEVLKLSRQNSQEINWATEDQMSKIDSVLKSVARDWSAEGADERSVVYEKMVRALEKYLPVNDSDGRCFEIPRIAVPGSGVPVHFVSIVQLQMSSLLTSTSINLFKFRFGQIGMGNTFKRLLGSGK